MREMKPNIKKISEDGGTERSFCLQAKSIKFIHKKEEPVVRCEDIKNYIFDLVL